MAERRRPAGGGSRYLYEPFEFASAHRVEANERIVENQFEAIEANFRRMEASLDRLERRMWMAVYGVAAGFLVQMARAYFDFGLGG